MKNTSKRIFILMSYLTFYSKVTPIKLYDPLSEFLGAMHKGHLDINYLDCVKLAGHSCPTVAGAYLMAAKGLDALYGSNLPVRGEIKLEIKNAKEEGVTGVTATIIAFIIGAGDTGGFKGIQGHFSRNALIHYNTPMEGAVKLTRLDTNESVTLRYDPSSILPDASMQALMGKSLQGVATEEEKATFGKLWQKRVEEILLNTHLHDQILTILKD